MLLLFALFASKMLMAQNVGIGTPTPVFKLDVKNGSINTDSAYRIGTITVLAVPGTGNLFIGRDAGMINSSSYNTFSGELAGSSNTTGNSNSFFGQAAGNINSTGDNNSFFGRATGSGNTIGSSNSFFGRSAAYANTSGNYNTAIGNSSLTTNTTGTLNTALGYNANVNTDALTNATAIGANARVDCNNCLVLGSINGINGATSGVNVGIGTTSPGAKLHVVSGSSGYAGVLFPGITLEGSSNTYFNLLTPVGYESGVLFGRPTDAANGGIVYNSTATLNGIQFRTNGNSTKMVLDQNGNVGIGVSNPDFPLSFSQAIGDKISLWSNSSNSYGFGIQSSLLQIHTDIAAADIAFGYGSSSAFTETMRIQGNGNVGIGTSTPFARLTFTDNSSGEIISFHGTSSNNFGIGIALGLLQIHSDQAISDIAFGYGSSGLFTEKMRIKGNGNVGVGTTTPQYKLHVEGTTFLNGNVGIGAFPGTAALRVGGSTILDGNVGIGTPAGSHRLEVNGITYLNGLVGIGTSVTSSLMLEVNGNAGKPGGGSWIATSDARMKENVLPYTDGLSMLLKINPVKYHYNRLSGYDTKPEYIGVMAQDIQSIVPYMVGSFQKNGVNYYHVDNSPMTYMLINAVKEQQQQIEELRRLVNKLLPR